MALAHRGVAADTESVSTRAIGGSMWKSRSVVLFVALLAVLSVVSSLGGASASAAAKSSKSK